MTGITGRGLVPLFILGSALGCYLLAGLHGAGLAFTATASIALVYESPLEDTVLLGSGGERP